MNFCWVDSFHKYYSIEISCDFMITNFWLKVYHELFNSCIENKPLLMKQTYWVIIKQCNISQHKVDEGW